MQIVKVKVCGTTSYEDAMAAVDAGADLVGFDFRPDSPRVVTVPQAAAIVQRLPAFAAVAGVFRDAPAREVHEAMDACHLDWIQLQGDEGPDYCRSLLSDHVRIIKALHFRSPADVARARACATDAVLLMTDPAHAPSLDWRLFPHGGKRVFLAGGIQPENAVAVVKLGVYGINVCRGVEASPGRKDPAKLRRLFENIRPYRG